MTVERDLCANMHSTECDSGGGGGGGVSTRAILRALDGLLAIPFSFLSVKRTTYEGHNKYSV